MHVVWFIWIYRSVIETVVIPNLLYNFDLLTSSLCATVMGYS